MAKNTGAYLSYFYQMLLPPLVIASMTILGRSDLKWLKSILIATTIFISLYHITLPQQVKVYEKGALNSLEFAKSITLNTTGLKLVSSPVLSTALNNNTIINFDNGHSEYFYTINIPTGINIIIDILFPKRYEHYQNIKNYSSEISEKIKRREFSLIVTNAEFAIIPREFILDNYIKFDSVVLQSGSQKWETEFWKPKP